MQTVSFVLLCPGNDRRDAGEGPDERSASKIRKDQISIDPLEAKEVGKVGEKQGLGW